MHVVCMGKCVPVAHVVKVLRELGEVRTLFFILFLCPKQNLGNLEPDEHKPSDE